MLTLRGFIDIDLQLILRLKEQAGWNQTPADLDRFRQLSPGGSFVAQWDGAPVGCVVTFEFGSVAWIAMMLVDESYRGRGIGRALMDRALEHLDDQDIATVRLDATSLGQPLYEKLGFVPRFQIGRFAGSPIMPEPGLPTHTAGVLLPGVEEHFEEVIELDRDVTRTDRRQFLLKLLEEHPEELRVVIHDRRVIGYLTSRLGANARQIGPCVGCVEAGPRLLADALERYQTQGVYVDVPLANHAAVAAAELHGLAVSRTLTRMCRGAEVIEDVPRLFASSSPEKG